MTAAAVAAAANDYTGELFVLGGIALAAILGMVGNVLVKRFREPTRIESLWERLDTQDTKIAVQGTKIEALEVRADAAERRDLSKGRIIRALARQWPEDHTPRLPPDDLAELDEDTVPSDHKWRAHP